MMGPSIGLVCGDVDLEGLGSDYIAARRLIGHYLLIDHPQYLPVMGTCVSVERH